MSYAPSVTDLADRARSLAGGGRVVIGIAGAPGVGKSTLAEILAAELGAPIIGMDGFHLRNDELHALGRHERKGAPDTFDVAAYCTVLRRLRTGEEVRGPVFDRAIEEPIAEAVLIPSAVPIVLTEGNYLLLEDGGWAGVRPLLDECWFLQINEALRVQRLVDRHIAYGRDPVEARRRATVGSDAANARLVEASAPRADLLIRG